MLAKRLCPWAEGILSASHAPDSGLQLPRETAVGPMVRSAGRSRAGDMAHSGVECQTMLLLGHRRWLFPMGILKGLGSSSGVDREGTLVFVLKFEKRHYCLLLIKEPPHLSFGSALCVLSIYRTLYLIERFVR
jgi:hypothetical protein